MTGRTNATDATDETNEMHGTRRSTLGAGLLGGFVGTAVMTLFRAPTARSLPPTADFLSRWVGGTPDDYPLSSLALHLAYGTGAGGTFGLVSPHPRTLLDEPETAGLFVGAVYGLVLSVFGERVVIRHLVGMDLDTDESAVFHAGHLVYGLTLGVWVGSRTVGDGEERGG